MQSEKWCKTCNKIFYEGEICPICNDILQNDIPTEVLWCSNCAIPIINEQCEQARICPICGKETKYLCKDLRPVFPEERLLIEILYGKPLLWKDKSVWVNNNRYYVNGKAHIVSFKKYHTADTDKIIDRIKYYSKDNDNKVFDETISLFIKANQTRLNLIGKEAKTFVINAAQNYLPDQRIVSFSGGKDSTVTADLVIKALRDPNIRHIFGDTTLETPFTHDYKNRYRKAHPKAVFNTAINKDQEFLQVCKDIGPPARMMRWCCTMFKTGPITRVLNSAFRDEKVLTFYGIRKSESTARSKYNRIEDDSSSVKIQKQAVASPIFFWSNLEIWLYILGEKLDFNDAYRLGYDRVGCWCCPNNNERSQFLSKIYMPKEWKAWRDYLISFAKSIGKPDPEEYVDGGWWKARQGGNGVEASEDVIIKQTNCTSEENAKIYDVNKPLGDDFYTLLTPFGKVSKELGRKIIDEVLVLDIKTNIPIISIQPYGKKDYDYAIKIKTMNVANHDDLHRLISYQVKKFNACRRCLKCESVCSFNAITISKNGYVIDENKCKRCKKCVSPKFIEGGCLMEKFLKTVRGK